MKICGKCKEEKSLEAFTKNSSRKDGLHSCCRECKSKEQRSWYKGANKSHRIKVNENRKARKNANAKLLYTYLIENPCKHCGETDPLVLEFDHLRDKHKNVSMLLGDGCSWNKILEEIEKCQVLCANCHRRKTAKEQGWILLKYSSGVTG